VNQFKKTGFPRKVLDTKLNFSVEGIFIKYLRWINMMMNDEIEEDSDLDQFNYIFEGLKCY